MTPVWVVEFSTRRISTGLTIASASVMCGGWVGCRSILVTVGEAKKTSIGMGPIAR